MRRGNGWVRYVGEASRYHPHVPRAKFGRVFRVRQTLPDGSVWVRNEYGIDIHIDARHIEKVDSETANRTFGRSASESLVTNA